MILVDGRTHSVTKYSWKRLSWVSSGWKVVKKWWPWRRATKVLGSLVEFEDVRDSGRRCGERQEIIWIGGSSGNGSKVSTTCSKLNIQQSQRGRETNRRSNEDTREWTFRFSESGDFEVSLERLDLRTRRWWEILKTNIEYQYSLGIPSHSARLWWTFHLKVPALLSLHLSRPLP